MWTERIYLIIFSLCRFDSELNKVGSAENPKNNEENETATTSKHEGKTFAKKRLTTGSKGGRKPGSKNRQVSMDENQHGREILVKDRDGDFIK